MKRIKYPIIVEGKYDKIKICSLFDATVITTDGFSIFNKNEKLSLLRSLAERGKIILLTDSDGGGHLIRSHIKSAIAPDKLINLYTPKVQGKEKRKRVPGKAGLLGVEGVPNQLIIDAILSCGIEAGAEEVREKITKNDLYELGLSGAKDSRATRQKLYKALSLPQHLSTAAFLDAVNLLYGREEFFALCEDIL
jgi:ribonuclease M5